MLWSNLGAVGNVFAKDADEPRLSEPRVGDEQDDVLHALGGEFPALLEQRDLAVAADERREAGRVRRVDPVAHRPLGPDRVDRNRPKPAAGALATRITIDGPVQGEDGA